jgi:hypothetical protein
MNFLSHISWKTMFSGLAAVGVGFFEVANGFMNGKPIDWALAGTSISTGIGLIFARDNNKTSEEVGAKHK